MTHSGELRSGKGSHDENFPVASRLIKRQHRPAILAFYEFVRVADDIADHPQLTSAEKIDRLDRLESSLLGNGGDEPEGLRLRTVLNERGLSPRHAQDLLSAFRQDATKLRYANWDELIDYCSRSAMPVGRFVLDVHGEARDTWPASDALVCRACRSSTISRIAQKTISALDRVYIPLDALSASGVDSRSTAGRSGEPGLAGLSARVGHVALQLCWRKAEGLSQRLAIPGSHLEISVIQSLASRLLTILMVRDPLAERVHLTKAEALATAVNGGGRAILRRLLRIMAPAQRYQTP